MRRFVFFVKFNRKQEGNYTRMIPSRQKVTVMKDNHRNVHSSLNIGSVKKSGKAYFYRNFIQTSVSV